MSNQTNTAQNILNAIAEKENGLTKLQLKELGFSDMQISYNLKRIVKDGYVILNKDAKINVYTRNPRKAPNIVQIDVNPVTYEKLLDDLEKFKENFKHITTDQLIELTGFSSQTVYKYIKQLLKDKKIKKTQNAVYEILSKTEKPSKPDNFLPGIALPKSCIPVQTADGEVMVNTDYILKMQANVITLINGDKIVIAKKATSESIEGLDTPQD